MDDLDFYDDLLNDIIEIANGDLNNEIKEVYQEEAEYMYTEITPRYKNVSRYRKGESGSFADRINFETNISRKNNRIKYQLRNYRLTDCTCSYCTSKDIFLDDLIEEGIYGKARLKPRPVSERVTDRIGQEELVENIIESRLRSKGWDVK